MPNSDDLYERHDELESRLDRLRAEFDELCAKYGTWDAEEQRIEEALDAVEAELRRLHDLINQLEQIEIDQQQDRPTTVEKSRDQLIAEIEALIADIEHSLNMIEKLIEELRGSLDPGGAEDDEE